MKVELLTSSSSLKDMEEYAALATLTCHANTGNMSKEGYKASDTLRRIIKAGHESILEHINLTYSVKGLSRACLQELARHRHISLSVESTRHTLREQSSGDITSLERFILPEDIKHKVQFIKSFMKFASQHLDMPNDELKYYIPEFWPTNLILTANIRSLRHIIKLRTAPAALNEFRVLAYSLYEAVPEEYRYMLTDCVYRELHPLSGGKEAKE